MQIARVCGALQVRSRAVYSWNADLETARTEESSLAFSADLLAAGSQTRCPRNPFVVRRYDAVIGGCDRRDDHVECVARATRSFSPGRQARPMRARAFVERQDTAGKQGPRTFRPTFFRTARDHNVFCSV